MVKTSCQNQFWKIFQIFVSEAVAAGINCFYCFLIPDAKIHGDLKVGLLVSLSVYVGIWITGPTSGGHMTPVVTLASLLTRRISLPIVPVYLCGQFVGAMGAMAIGWTISPYRPEYPRTYGMTIPGPNVSDGVAVLVEAIITFTLILVMVASLDELRPQEWRLETGNNFPISIMLVLFVNIMIAADISGGSMNPTRSITAAIMQRNFDRQWIYFVGPPIGCILACLIYELVLLPYASLRRTRMFFTSPDFNRNKMYSETEVDTRQEDAINHTQS